MITLATLKDEMVDGQRRALGKKVRRITAICLDSYNVVLAEGVDPTKLTCQRFYGSLIHLANGLKKYGLDVEHARLQMLEFLKRYLGDQVGDLTWAQMEECFSVTKRLTDGRMALYEELKNRGWKEAA